MRKFPRNERTNDNPLNEFTHHFQKNRPKFSRRAKIALIANYTFMKGNDINYFYSCYKKIPDKSNLGRK